MTTRLTFPEISTLHVYRGDSLIAFFHHPNPEALDKKEAELLAAGFEVVRSRYVIADPKKPLPPDMRKVESVLQNVIGELPDVEKITLESIPRYEEVVLGGIFKPQKKERIETGRKYAIDLKWKVGR